MISEFLLKILCCPKCRGELMYEPEKDRLTCRTCSRIYRIKNNIPVMIDDDRSEHS
ncbi:MAG TPA: Trm112 family protein [Bacteroidota bacterium]|nr:Trm112 family protein [Bacteroidota bacterium]